MSLKYKKNISVGIFMFLLLFSFQKNIAQEIEYEYETLDAVEIETSPQASEDEEAPKYIEEEEEVKPYRVPGKFKIEEVPSPKIQGQDFFVSNPNGILSLQTENELNRISVAIEKATGAEYAIVMVKDYDGPDDFEFALALFNRWGVGKAGADNGLLLFIAENRHEYRFISGYGVEGIFTDYYLKAIGEKYLVPNFRNYDYDKGVIEASQLIERVFLAPDSQEELAHLLPEAAPFWNLRNPILNKILIYLAVFLLVYLYIYFVEGTLVPKKMRAKFSPIFKGMGCMLVLMFFSVFVFAFVFDNVEKVYRLKNLPYFILVLCALIITVKLSDSKRLVENTFKRDRETQTRKLKKWTGLMLLLILVNPLLWGIFVSMDKRYSRDKKRFAPPDNSGDWTRINRNDVPLKPKKYMDPGQLKEEALHALRYEIWKNTKTGNIKLVPWERDLDYQNCPNCGYCTYKTDLTKTIIPATYSSAGEGERYGTCFYCDFEKSLGRFTIPRKTRSSSSGGGSSRSSGGSSSGSSGSFGGGSSGGGGAGGRW